MKKHWVSVAIFLVPVMTCGWLTVGLFIWALIPHFTFSEALLVSACITATDPILAAAVVGKGKFAERVPGHLRNVLTAESGCNDGMAFPFIYLSLNIILYSGNAGEIMKEWILITILWECVFGIVLGVAIGLTLRHAVSFAERKTLIDRESFLAIFIFIGFISAGIGSMLGVDDLLTSFAAGTAFGWNGYFAKKTEESHVSTVIDLLLNLSFFVYFGAIIPWPQFNNAEIGLNAWRLVVLAIVVIFLRRLPAVVALKPLIPDVKTWREAIFCGHFGPIGVGAVFAAILARKGLEQHYTSEETPLFHLPPKDFPHYQLLAAIWPIVSFIVIVSIIVHGSSVAVLTLGKRLNRMAITMTFTTTNTQEQGPSWMSRLQKLDKASTSFSLHRIDTEAPHVSDDKPKLSQSNTIETSGVKVRPAGGAKRRRNMKKKKDPKSRIQKTLSRVATQDSEGDQNHTTERQRPQTEFLQLGRTPSTAVGSPSDDEDIEAPNNINYNMLESRPSPTSQHDTLNETDLLGSSPTEGDIKASEEKDILSGRKSVASTAFQEGSKIIIEDQNGEIIETVPVKGTLTNTDADDTSIHSMGSLRRHMSEFSRTSSDKVSIASNGSFSTPETILGSSSSKGNKKAFYKKGDPKHRKVYAHRTDNFIVIENADGDIIRRYKLNRHSSTRKRSNKVVSKMMSLVGIKNKNAKANHDSSIPGANDEDIEMNEKQNVLIPQNDGIYTSNDPMKDPKFESAIENKLTNILTNKDKNVDNSKEGAQDSVDSHDEDEYYSDSDISDEDEILQETEIEKRRRLAALGQMPTTRREEDEED